MRSNNKSLLVVHRLKRERFFSSQFFLSNAAQTERKNLQDKLSACVAELDSERKELARLRQEEAELQSQHAQSVENFRSEITRLHDELRSAGSVFTQKQLFGLQAITIF